jgi:glycosyltransferase involved in cell wall biosynthesis
MKKITIVTYYFQENIVGTQRVNFLYKHLRANGYDIDLVTKYRFGKICSRFKMLWLISLFGYLVFSRGHKVFVTSSPFWYLPVVYAASCIKQKNVIYDFRDPWSFDMEYGYGGTKNKGSPLKVKIARLLEKRYYNSCEYFFVCSDGSYESYLKLFGNDKKLKLVLNGYELSKKNTSCEEKSLKDSPAIKIVCLGRLLIHGKEKIEKAFHEIKQYRANNNLDVTLVFVGSEKNELIALTKKHGLYDNSIFFDKMPHQHAISIASCCDIGLCTVRDENLIHGTKIFDYIGLGLPVLDVFDKNKRLFNFFEKYIISIDMIGGSQKYEPPVEYNRQYIFNHALKYFQ